MVTRTAIVQAALSWVGTPYHHKARVKGVGTDCIQFIVGVCIETGILTQEEAAQVPMNYSPRWHLHENASVLEQYIRRYGCQEITKEQAQPGDLVCFQFGRTTAHSGFLLSPYEFIHALWEDPPACVTKQKISTDYKKRLRKAFVLPGVV
jgi:NlpC/P60 family putative phage cell wall peptidase